eukprot:TRINITY_DN6390_c0_g1_i6.p1 TRINITY_DN6390_c0_g1~~TRINITY_DN6390_c0_g1_i6.p1  ORF type:complete len:356 (+),score=58.69 TRINITY_DN6390_c0_g1_i6:76-1143(+)
MDRPIASLPISPLLKNKLLQCGFRVWKDLTSTSAADLAREIGVAPEDAMQILKSGRTENTERRMLSSGRSALELLKKERTQTPISTSSTELDRLLGGGVSLNKITEFCGVPGIGKTQLGIQLALNVQRPSEQGRLSGECIYIDTEGSFIPERVYEMAVSWVDAFIEKNPESTEQSGKIAVSPENLMSHIHYYRIRNVTEQIALNHALPKFLATHPQVRLIVVDSITFHFRHDFDDMGQRSRLLQSSAQSFLNLAEQYNLAVVLMNQATTKIDSESDAHLAPALGESWGHTCTHRIILYWSQGQRHAYLSKSPTLKPQTVVYQVTGKGIEDVEASGDAGELPKRQRRCDDTTQGDA